MWLVFLGVSTVPSMQQTFDLTKGIKTLRRKTSGFKPGGRWCLPTREGGRCTGIHCKEKRGEKRSSACLFVSKLSLRGRALCVWQSPLHGGLPGNSGALVLSFPRSGPELCLAELHRELTDSHCSSVRYLYLPRFCCEGLGQLALSEGGRFWAQTCYSHSAAVPSLSGSAGRICNCF